MTKTIKGKIEGKNKDQGTSKNGKKYTRYVFEMEDGKKYSTFDDKIGEKYNVGDEVAYTVKKSGKYWNLVNMMNVEDYEGNYDTMKGEDEVGEATKVISLLNQMLQELKKTNTQIDDLKGMLIGRKNGNSKN